MRRKEIDLNQLDLFKPQSEPAAKEIEQITGNEWKKADKLAFEMTVDKGKMIKNPSREERKAEDEEIEKGFRILRAKLGLPPKKGDQGEMPLKIDEK